MRSMYLHYFNLIGLVWDDMAIGYGCHSEAYYLSQIHRSKDVSASVRLNYNNGKLEGPGPYRSDREQSY